MTAKVFGEENPTQGETAVSWQTWSNGTSGTPEIDGDPDWGRLKLLSGQEARSAVYDIGSTGTFTFTLTENLYGSSFGTGSAISQIRGDIVTFNQDDNVPVWEEYIEPISRYWRYIQIGKTRAETFDQSSGSVVEE